MKNLFLSLFLILSVNISQAQGVNPVFLELKNKAENCFKVKDYACCAKNYGKSLIIAPTCEECKLKMQNCKNAIEYGFLLFQKSGKWGLMNTKGKIFLQPMYEKIWKFPDYKDLKSNTFWVSNSKAIALYDLDLNQFLTGFDYSEPLMGDDWGLYKFVPLSLIGENHEVLINRKGKVIDKNYEHLTDFHKKIGLYGFKKGNKWGFMDDSFKEIIPPTYDTMNWDDNDTKIYVSHNKKSFVIDRQGKCIENCK
jgi:hypothetical protein